MFRFDEEWLKNYQKRMDSYKTHEKTFKLNLDDNMCNLSNNDKKSKYGAKKCEYERNKV